MKKLIVTLSMIFAVSFMQAQRYELQEKGANTILLVDTANSNKVLFNKAKEDIKFVANEAGTGFYIYLDALNVTEYKLVNGKSFTPSEVLNPDTSLAFISVTAALNWSYDNLNFNPATGGSVASTGTVINLSRYYQYNMESANTAATYTTSNVVPGGYANVLVNRATEPTVTGATKITNTASFIPNTDMVMVVMALGTNVKYFFFEY